MWIIGSLDSWPVCCEHVVWIVLSFCNHKIVTGHLFVRVNGKPLRVSDSATVPFNPGKFSFNICVTEVEAIPQSVVETHSIMSFSTAFHAMACLFYSHGIYLLLLPSPCTFSFYFVSSTVAVTNTNSLYKTKSTSNILLSPCDFQLHNRNWSS